MVELALLMPVLLWLCAGIVDFGRVYYYDIVAINAARVGARAAADSRNTGTAAAAAATADAGTVAVSVDAIPATRTPGSTVTVTVRFTFTPITPLIGTLFPGGSITVTRSASMVVF